VLDRSVLIAGRDAMRHRGPDDAGEWWSADGCVGLGHRRLAIIDLSAGGHQPMASPNGALQIVFNGEIYNYLELRRELLAKGHTFLSESDTEVILAAYQQWGSDCLARLNGMFAFALYDASRRELFLARDRAGEKPLFYAHSGDALHFGSELKALLADPAIPRNIEPQALDCYLNMGFVPGALCILQGVRKLPPGHALTFSLVTGQSREWRYWRLPDPLSRRSSPSEAELLEELESLLADSVRRQLIADVPVGVLLSGGVDSSLITAMAVRAARKVKTFTIRFPEHPAYDETEHARLIARHFGTEHVELEAGSSTVDLLPALARQFDEPLVDSSMIPTYLVSRVTREHCKVALGGDGGDELFGGYHHYNRLLRMQQTFGRIPRLLRVPVARAAALLPVGFKGRNWLQALEVDLDQDLPLIASYFDARSRRRLMRSRRDWRTVGEEIRARALPHGPDLLQRATRCDFENYLAGDILVKVDRASMLNSLEVRAPLLDYRVIDFAFGKVPSNLKASSTNRKILLKQLAKRVLPREFDLRRKQGFSIPLGNWLERGPWRQFFREVLQGSNNTYFDERELASLLRGQDRGRANGERLFALVMFELWRREYGARM
jgi:asparagine synthase (glutamine-hydrolysing)